MIFFSRPQITRKPLILLAQINLRNPHDDGRRENFFGATAQPHTNRTTAQVGQKWRHLSRRGARGRDQLAIRRPTIAPRVSTFRPFRPLLAVERTVGRTGKRPTGRTDERRDERTDTQARSRTDGEDERRAGAITTPRVDKSSGRLGRRRWLTPSAILSGTALTYRKVCLLLITC